ncbi:MAG: aldose 1-epimerase [Neomegalonema sp.]|nr:aldose 1-epimerase [Neomegalonema sp.]
MTSVQRYRICSSRYIMELVPERGASVVRLAWRRGSREWCELLRRAADSDIDDRSVSLSKLSNFVMLPFVNRIDKARFNVEGTDYTLPLNRPEQDCAIHGFSREHAWRVLEADPDRLICEDRCERSDIPYRYVARQVFEAAEDGVVIGLSVENTGEAPMPFGFGLHPWFRRDSVTQLAFGAALTLEGDERTFPISARPVSDDTSFKRPQIVALRAGTDRAYSGWSGNARIEQPSERMAITLEASREFRNLHIFIPRDQPLFCVEPVTHVTDVLNRRQFAAYGDMAMLQPGQTLSGTVSIIASPLA